MRNETESKVMELFNSHFPGNNDDVRLFFAPGRVNLIGEHTDYNGGYVFPAALSIGTYMVIRKREDRFFSLKSSNFDQEVMFSLKDLAYKTEDDWGNYPKGVIRELAKSQELTGADLFFYGNLPNGAGLSSSASIGMVTAFGLSETYGLNQSIKDLAVLCQRMENQFIGVNSGLMDQLAVGLGEKSKAVFINCNTMETEHVPLHMPGYKVVVTNTNKRRGLADSKYNERRRECEEGLSIIKAILPELETLSNLSLSEFNNLKNTIENDVILKRVRHVVSENARVLEAIAALKNGDLIAFGEKMIQSHISLRDDYEVTGNELDALFEIQNQFEGCIGSRMTGAGFGGCTVSVVKEAALLQFEKEVAEKYVKKTGITPSFYISDIGDGVKELKGVMS